MKNIYLLFLITCCTSNLFSQNPWERPLKMAWSNDGITFNTSSVFQDSSGVPSVIRWKGDTLICVFQWFRIPDPSPTWDRIAVKFSYDNGLNWTQPVPIEINGLPSDYQRPFDPTLVNFGGDSLRIYFSSSNGFPAAGLDSTVNTYSAVSIDGIHYSFETNARVDELTNRVIDPAVIFFNNAYHYLSPIGSPQQGAYHYVSPDGINFMKVPDIPSDNNHNWTGNYMINDTNELRFYGSGFSGVWFNSTSNGGVWNGYSLTNIQGGDPSVVKASALSYLMIYVGNPYSTGLNNVLDKTETIFIYPNPARHVINVKSDSQHLGKSYTIYDKTGRSVSTGKLNSVNAIIELNNISEGVYMLRVGEHINRLFVVVKE